MNFKKEKTGDLMRGSINLLILFSFIFAISCTEKRDNQCKQGGCDYIKISALQGKKYKVNILSLKNEINDSASFKIESKSNYGELEIETDAEYMPENSKFYGFADKKYELQYKITEKWLKIYKLTDPDGISFSESTYADLVGGKKAALHHGYKITLHKREMTLNGDNEKTHVYSHVQVYSLAKATHIKFDVNSPVAFKEMNKNEVLPTDFFEFAKENHSSLLNSKQEDTNNLDDTEWYFTARQVEGSYDRNAANGMYMDSYGMNIDTEGAVATRVKFVKKSETEVWVVNALKPDTVSSRSLNYNKVMTIGAKYLSPKVQEDGTDSGMEEVDDVMVHYKDKKFVQLNLLEIKHPYIKASEKTRLLSFEKQLTGDKYFNFLIEHNQYGRSLKVRYFFRKVMKKSSLEKRYAFREDMKMFGVLKMQKKAVVHSGLITVDDYDRHDLLIRHDTSEPVTFHISNTTQKKYYGHARETISIWNEYLAKVDSKLRLKFNDQPVNYGDNRYNIIDFSKPDVAIGFLGVSHSSVDGATGEIITTVAKTDVRGIEDMNYSFVRGYIFHELGLIDEDKIFSIGQSNDLLNMSMVPDAELKKMPGMDIFETSNILVGLNKTYAMVNRGNAELRLETPPHLLVDEALKFYGIEVMKPTNTRNLKAFVEPIKPKVSRSDMESMGMFNCSYAQVNGDVIREIKEFCGKEPFFKDYMSQLKTQSKRSLMEVELDHSIVEQCTSLITTKGKSLIHTAVHEVGHSLGLSHNFIASFDKDNHYKPGDTNTPNDEAKTSSVMDYIPEGFKILTVPGKNDLATIKYLYDGQVELKTGGFVDINDFNKPLSKQPDLKNIKKYMTCTNKDLDYLADPFCLQHDYGTTPLEVVQNIIAKYEVRMASKRDRFNKYRFYNSDAATFKYTFLPLKRIYDEWRHELTSEVGVYSQYLMDYHPEFKGKPRYDIYEDFLQNSLDVKFYNSYRPAIRLIQEFLLDKVAFMPNHYCLTESTSNGERQLIEMSKIRLNQARNGTVIKSCTDSGAQSYFRFHDLKLLMDENGEAKEYGRTLRSDWSRNDNFYVSTHPFDELGSFMDRFQAMNIITHRGSTKLGSYTKGIRPNFMDEPDFRNRFETKLLERIYYGVSGSFLNDKDPKLTNKFYLNFSEEKNLLFLFASLYRNSLYTDNLYSFSDRTEPFLITIRPDFIFSGGGEPENYFLSHFKVGNLYLGVSSPKSYQSLMMIQQVKYIKDVLDVSKKLEPLSNRDFAHVISAANTYLPQNSDELTLRNLIAFQEALESTIENAYSSKIVYFLNGPFKYINRLAKNFKSSHDTISKRISESKEDQERLIKNVNKFKDRNEKYELEVLTANINKMEENIKNQLDSRVVDIYDEKDLTGSSVLFGKYSSKGIEQEITTHVNSINIILKRRDTNPEELRAQLQTFEQIILYLNGGM